MATQPTPAAMRAMKAISFHYGASTAQPLPWESLARLIDEETGLPVLLEALKVILFEIDYDQGRCRPNEMIGAVVPKELLIKARNAIAKTEGREKS